MDPRIEKFLASPAFGVARAPTNRDKYGNKVVRVYQHADEMEGLRCVAAVGDLPDDVQSLSVVTPPKITEEVVEQAIAKGIRHIWMQPGAESAQAVARCKEAGLNVIADGSCVLVVLGFREGH